MMKGVFMTGIEQPYFVGIAWIDAELKEQHRFGVGLIEIDMEKDRLFEIGVAFAWCDRVAEILRT